MSLIIQEKSIVTAPKDGTIVAVADLENDFILAFWDHKMDDPFWAGLDEDCIEIDFVPTGWITADEYRMYDLDEAEVAWL